MGFLVTVLGVVLVVEGAPWFLSPGCVKRLLWKVLGLPDQVLRLTGFAAMFLGLLLVYSARW